MTLEQLRESCGDGTGQITIVLPRTPTGEGIRLTPRSGPIGYVMCVNNAGNTVARFDARAVLRWIDRHFPTTNEEPRTKNEERNDGPPRTTTETDPDPRA